jgi:hypothetical protein
MSLDTKEKQEWLDGLKVGDIVAVKRYSPTGNHEYSFRRIEKITPTRRMTVGGVVYKNGEEMGCNGWSVPRDIIPATEEIASEITRKTILREISKFDFSSLDNDKLLSLYDVMKGLRNEPTT